MTRHAILALLLAATLASQSPTAQEWASYGGVPGGTKYSPLTDIDRDNVGRLQVAWEWKPGDEPREEFGTRPGNFQNTPLMIDNVLYVSTPYNRVVYQRDIDAKKKIDERFAEASRA